MQFAVVATLQRIHHDHAHFLAILAFVPSFAAFLAATCLSFRLATMTLATAGTIFFVSVHLHFTSFGGFRPSRWSRRDCSRKARTGRFCNRKVPTTVRMRSTKRQPASL